MKGIRIQENEGNGYTICFVHYSADPFKDAAWVAQEKKNFPNPNDWDRLYEIGFRAVEGQRIYPTFSRSRHIALLNYDPLRPILRGWDFGVAYSCCKFYQIDRFGRLLVLAEKVGRKVSSFADFVSDVLDFCDSRFESIEKDGHVVPIKYEDYADFAGTYHSDGQGKVYIEILAGKNVKAASVPFHKTLKDRAIEMMRRRLDSTVTISKKEDGTEIKTARCLVDESCEITIEAMAGSYVFDDRGRPKSPNHPYEEVMDVDHYVLAFKDNLVGKKKKTKESSRQRIKRINPISGYFN